MDAPLIEGEDSNLYDVMGSDESPSLISLLLTHLEKKLEEH